MQISTHKRKTGVVSPKRFINRLKRDNELFRGYMHQVCSTPVKKQPFDSMKWLSLMTLLA